MGMVSVCWYWEGGSNNGTRERGPDDLLGLDKGESLFESIYKVFTEYKYFNRRYDMT